MQGFGTDQVIIAVSCFILGAGLMSVWRLYRNEATRETLTYVEAGEAKVEVRLEYDNDGGGIYYIIHNMGKATAHDVRAYLPKCHDIASKKTGPNAQDIAAGITKVMMKRYDRMNAGEKVEIPLTQVPPSEENRKNVYSLGLDVELRWSNAQGDVTKKEYIVPVFTKRIKRQAVAA